MSLKFLLAILFLAKKWQRAIMNYHAKSGASSLTRAKVAPYLGFFKIQNLWSGNHLIISGDQLTDIITYIYCLDVLPGTSSYNKIYNHEKLELLDLKTAKLHKAIMIFIIITIIKISIISIVTIICRYHLDLLSCKV